MPSTMNHKQVSIQQALSIAKQHHQDGHLARAAKAYRAILLLAPRHSDANYLYGLVEYRLGRPSAAKALIAKALDYAPLNALAWASLAQIKFDEQDFKTAKRHFAKAYEIKPDNANIANGLGLAHMRLGDSAASKEIFVRALSSQPKAFYPRFNLAGLESKAGNASQALKHYQVCLKLKPKDATVHNCLGAVFFSRRQFEEAFAAFERVIDLQPLSAEAHNNLGAIYMQRKQYQLALQQFSCSLHLWSAFGQAHVNAALAHQLLGQSELAKEMIGLASRIMEKDDVLPRLVSSFVDLRQLYESQQQLNESRQLYTQGLQEFFKFTKTLNAAGRKSLEHLIGYTQPFYLPYQGGNDKQLQVLYGKCMAFKKVHDRPLDQFNVSPARALKVGIVSAFFYDHSNWKIPIRGWMRAISERLQVVAYYTGAKVDECTREAQSLAMSFHQNLSFEELCAQIERDQIDVLIYPEIGMDQLTARLASHRLAPVQCTSWGHPVTSGLKSIDYFLSSDLMEPADGQQWYSEQLLRLPELSFTWQADALKMPPGLSRAGFDLHEHETVFLCVQNMSKYLPQFDSLLAEIAAQLSSAKFVFIRSANHALQHILYARLDKVFAAHGLAVKAHVQFLDRLDSVRFRALNAIADVCLDTPLWSGCNSSLEAIAVNLPIVTWPGDSMRSRHTSAIYNKMGFTDLIAHNRQDYVNLALRLANDTQFYNQMHGKINRHKPNLAQGQQALGDALCDFFTQAIDEFSAKEAVRENQ